MCVVYDVCFVWVDLVWVVVGLMDVCMCLFDVVDVDGWCVVYLYVKVLMVVCELCGCVVGVGDDCGDG